MEDILKNIDMLTGDASMKVRLAGMSVFLGIGVYQLLAELLPKQLVGTDRAKQASIEASTQGAKLHRSKHPLKMRTPAAEVARLAYYLSDVVFVYQTGVANEQAQLLQDWQLQGIQNSKGNHPSIHQLDVRAGAGNALVGMVSTEVSSAEKSLITVLTSSQSLAALTKALFSIGKQKCSIVFHVALHHVDESLKETLDTTPLQLLNDLGVVVLTSSSAEDIVCNSYLAYCIARTHTTVIHIYDGVRIGRTLQKVSEVSALLPELQATSQLSIKQVFDLASPVLGKRVSFFEYDGSPKAQTAVIVIGSIALSFVEACKLKNAAAAKEDQKVGLLVVRVLKPWNEAEFLANLPTSVIRLAVVEASSSSASTSMLYSSVAIAVRKSKRSIVKIGLRRLKIDSHGIPVQLAVEVFDSIRFSSDAIDIPTPPTVQTVPANKPQQTGISLWGKQDIDTLTTLITSAIALEGGCNATAYLSQDQFSSGGVTVSEIISSNDTVENTSCALDAYNAVIIESWKLFQLWAHLIIPRLVQGATVIVLQKYTNDNINEDLPSSLVQQLAQKKIHLKCDGPQATTESVLSSLHIILRLLCSSSATADNTVDQCLRQTGLSVEAAGKIKLSSLSRVESLTSISLANVEDSSEEDTNVNPQFQPRAKLSTRQHSSKHSKILSKAEATWRMLYKDAYKSNQGVRPGYEGVYRVKLTKNQRLTPHDYHRNVFHLEMDIRNTGLTYNIGDALGVYGQNDTADVDGFLKHLGVSPDELIEFNHPEQPDKKEITTVATLFTEKLDVFGKPSQKFYETLAAYATDSYHRAKLEWLGTEDKEGFKIRQFETFSFADVMYEFDSAKPPITDLVQMIPLIKPRHYSISSSMKMCPESVHLLVVLVDWETPAGRKRFGQCTRYLANLRPENNVILTVDIKPSAMHLPEDPKQPIIMAGLGTGMAPFRAFVQEREWQRQQGIEVGPVMLYFGSRHRHEEYLYGDYLDLMHESKLISNLGLAFSRDQPQKIYIQHKIVEDRKYIADYLLNHRGHFYLCGPTWPVPDIRKAIADGLEEETSMSQDDIDAFLDELKEEGRYVLEVY